MSPATLAPPLQIEHKTFGGKTLHVFKDLVLMRTLACPDELFLHCFLSKGLTYAVDRSGIPEAYKLP